MFKSVALSIRHHIVELRKETTAAGALEYALLAAFIAMAVVSGATAFGTALKTWFTTMGTTIGKWTAS